VSACSGSLSCAEVLGTVRMGIMVLVLLGSKVTVCLLLPLRSAVLVLRVQVVPTKLAVLSEMPLLLVAVAA